MKSKAAIPEKSSQGGGEVQGNELSADPTGTGASFGAGAAMLLCTHHPLLV